MAKTESRFWTFSKAMGTLAGSVLTAVLAAVLIQHFTRPPALPSYAQIGLTGIVSNAANQQPVVDAQVTAVAGISIAKVKTDNQGRYSFVLDGTASGTQSVMVDIVAGGYPFYRSGPLTVSAGDNFVAFPLSSTAAPSTEKPTSPGQPAAPPPESSILVRPQILRGLPANFRKPAMTVRLASKP